MGVTQSRGLAEYTAFTKGEYTPIVTSKEVAEYTAHRHSHRRRYPNEEYTSRDTQRKGYLQKRGQYIYDQRPKRQNNNKNNYNNHKYYNHNNSSKDSKLYNNKPNHNNKNNSR